MVILLFLVALGLVGGGFYSISWGLPLIVMERGWTWVIAGSVFASSGFILFALALILRALYRLPDSLEAAHPDMAAEPETVALRDRIRPPAPDVPEDEPAVPIIRPLVERSATTDAEADETPATVDKVVPAKPAGSVVGEEGHAAKDHERGEPALREPRVPPLVASTPAAPVPVPTLPSAPTPSPPKPAPQKPAVPEAATLVPTPPRPATLRPLSERMPPPPRLVGVAPTNESRPAEEADRLESEKPAPVMPPLPLTPPPPPPPTPDTAKTSRIGSLFGRGRERPPVPHEPLPPVPPPRVPVLHPPQASNSPSAPHAPEPSPPPQVQVPPMPVPPPRRPEAKPPEPRPAESRPPDSKPPQSGAASPDVPVADADVTPPRAPEPQRELAGDAPAPDAAAPTVVGTYNAGGTLYVMYSDGSIEAETASGVTRFASLDALKDHIARGDGG